MPAVVALDEYFAPALVCVPFSPILKITFPYAMMLGSVLPGVSVPVVV